LARAAVRPFLYDKQVERCNMCGARIAPASYRVVVPELDTSFCSASCAERALQRARRPRPVGPPAPAAAPAKAVSSVSPELALVDETLRRVV
jgi:hypothetical protein